MLKHELWNYSLFRIYRQEFFQEVFEQCHTTFIIERSGQHGHQIASWRRGLDSGDFLLQQTKNRNIEALSLEKSTIVIKWAENEVAGRDITSGTLSQKLRRHAIEQNRKERWQYLIGDFIALDIKKIIFWIKVLVTEHALPGKFGGWLPSQVDH
jgi:hypothetical protein